MRRFAMPIHEASSDEFPLGPLSAPTFVIDEEAEAVIGIAKDPDTPPACPVGIQLWSRPAKATSAKFTSLKKEIHVQGNMPVSLKPDVVYMLVGFAEFNGAWEQAACLTHFFEGGRVFRQGWSDNHSGVGEDRHYDFHTVVALI
jgi:hypothetical protein